MRRLVSLAAGALVLALTAGPVRAGSILYATAATLNRIDAFCVGENGGLSPKPVFSRTLPLGRNGATQFVRRLLVKDDKVLYAALKDRVLAFTIERDGKLVPLGQPACQVAMNPYDLALAPNGQYLYVPQRGQSRIVAYPINDDGSLGATGDPTSTSCPKEPTGFASCIQGSSFSAYEALWVQGSRLYVTAATQPGRIQTFTIAPDGNLPAPPVQCELSEDTDNHAGDTECETVRDCETVPDSQRLRVNLPLSLVVNGDLLYVTEGVKKRILAFQLMPDGNFPPKMSTANGERQVKPFGKTSASISYRHLVLNGSVLIGSEFSNGRIEAIQLRSDGKLPPGPRLRSGRDLRASPVRMLISGSVLYVAGGELDRLWAFRLDPATGLPGVKPFSRTDEQKGSFPNDVAVAVLSGACGS